MITEIFPSMLNGTLSAVSSKSYAHRIIVASMLSDKETKIKINGFSEDIIATLECIKSIGGDFTINGNTVTITPVKDVKEGTYVYCNESGTTARIMVPICAALCKCSTVDGGGRLPQRPFSEIVRELRNNGAEIDSDSVPMKIEGKIKSGIYEIEGNISSQYITGLLLALPLTESDSEIILKTPLESAAYVDMTIDVLEKFGIQIRKTDRGYIVPSSKYISPGEIIAEGDWSNSAFWVVADKLGSKIDIQDINSNSRQGDRKICDVLDDTSIDVSEIPDLFPILSVLAAGRKGETLLHNARRLRLKESDRIESTNALLQSLGCKTEVGEDYLRVFGTGTLEGGIVDGYNDHRIVMSAAIASVICKNKVVIKGAEAVNKSYPDFFKEFERLGGKVNVI